MQCHINVIFCYVMLGWVRLYRVIYIYICHVCIYIYMYVHAECVCMYMYIYITHVCPDVYVYTYMYMFMVNTWVKYPLEGFPWWDGWPPTYHVFWPWHILWMEGILHQLVTIGNYIWNTVNRWGYGIDHLPTGAGFLPSTVCIKMCLYVVHVYMTVHVYMLNMQH